MSYFYEKVKQDTPRLVVEFKIEGGKELFQWGIVGQIPLLTVIGAVDRAQSGLHTATLKECPERGLVIAYDPESRTFETFAHPDTPIESMIGMLEAIKETLVSTHMARAAANQQFILGPDGRPMGRR